MHCYSVLLKNKINLRNKFPIFFSPKLGLFINKKIYPFFIKYFFDFLVFKLLRKKDYLLMPVPQEIINFFYKVKSIDKKGNKGEKLLGFSKKIYLHIKVAKEHKLFLNRNQLPESLYGLGRLL